MTDPSGHLLDSLTGRQRLFDRLDRIERRLEEAIAYFAIRSNRVSDSQSVFLGDHTAVTFLEGGIRILVDTRSIDIGIHLLTLGRWETGYTSLFTRLVKPGDTVLDLGANHGVYALLAAQIVGPTGRVDAFEPNPRLAHLVDLSLRLNGFSPWASVHAVGVSEAAGTARLVFVDSFSGGGSIAAPGTQQTQPGVDCRLVALDEMFADPAYRPDVIKMDVEGHEGRALRGMRRLLERAPGVRIMMEFAPEMMARAGVPAAEVADMLGRLGLRPWMIDHEGALTGMDWGAVLATASGIQNILVAREEPA
ncbi:FkbM family methyltransferase [Roseomonas terrae]|uniref:FkbM family methyltransferase n=1 Tax=Neoroseomonas terrae TaxID=424799 RepID=A0ABS5EI13_9PROT|nr:FkbM family methyltransferase [Neoroseomonas terrae]MBR0650669.1 FkbM family methyltransferase [Neoroseomonas terrae]